MNYKKCSSCHNGYNHLICTMCRYMFCEMCLDFNHHDSTIDYYLKELDMIENHDIIICGHCLYSYKRLIKLIDKGVINNDELLSDSDKYI